MPAAARSNLDSAPRRSPRLKNINVLYDEDSDRDSFTLKPLKVEVTDHEEILSPSTSEVSEEDGEHGFHNISLKDLRARCKAKNRKASKITSEGPDIRTQAESLNPEDEKTQEEVDLSKPLIALKQKRQRTSPSKANKRMDVLTSPLCDVKVEDTTSESVQTPPGQVFPLEEVRHDSVIEKLETRPTDLEHSTITVDCTKEIVGEETCCAKEENSAEPLVNCENSDILDIYSEKAGRNCYGYSSVELQEVQRQDDRCRPQLCFMNQPTKSAHVSDHSCELISSTKACNLGDVAEEAADTVSSLDLVEVSDHQNTPEDITNSDTDKYSIRNESFVCSFNQSCDDDIYDAEYWNTGVVEGNEPERVNILEGLSPIDESNTNVMSPLAVIQSDLCGSIDMKCTSLEEVVQIRRDSQLDTIVCCGVRPKQISQDREIKHATTDYTFVYDKTPELAQPADFFAQDGRLESIVYDALNNHTQKMTFENRSSVGGLPDTAVVWSPDFTDNCSGDEVSLLNYAEWSLKNLNNLNSTTDYGICKSIQNEGSGEVQAQLFEACLNKETTCLNKKTTSGIPSGISIAEKTQGMPARAPNSSVASLETEGQHVKSDMFVDEESIEEHAPKKLLSKRKIMSPSAQEKLCNALTGIDLCDRVKRLKSNIIVEDHEKTRISLPHPAHKGGRSTFSTYRRLRGRTSFSPTRKGVPKSGEIPSHQQTTCSCKRSSSVVLDTDKAVEFSQRQMHDIENIAAKLIKSLKHMRSIVDETLSSEAYSVVPNFSIAEIRAASEDALEVEKTTRKWLTIMNKDCNRFCKILTLAKKKDVSHHEAPRKQRKITFADEAGGKLCHIKVFNDKQTSFLSECQSDV